MSTINCLDTMDDFHEHQHGPDYVMPTNNIRTWSRDGVVRLDITKTGPNSHIPLSVPTCLKNMADQYPDKFAYCVNRDGQWQKTTYRQLHDTVRLVAKAFIQLGLKRLNAVAIFGFNSTEWVISQMGAIFAGGIAVGIYTTNSQAACEYILKDSEANICLVDNEEKLKKILNCTQNCTQLRAIVQWTGEPLTEQVISWKDLLEIGRNVPDEVLERRLRGISINQACFMMYTSGTTATPKGVLANHDSIIHQTRRTMIDVCHRSSDDTIVSFLPMNHLGGQIMDVFTSLLVGQTVYFANPDALKGSIFESMRKLRPTAFFSVPRIWEKLYERAIDIEKNMTFWQRIVLSWCKQIGTTYSLSVLNGSNNVKQALLDIAKKIALNKLTDQLGLSDAKCLLCGSAPIDNNVLEYFWSLGIIVQEIYGLTECVAMSNINRVGEFRVKSVGRPLAGLEIRIDEPDASGNGEICIRGRQIFMGYLNKEKETVETLDDEGWLHTGDIGVLDNDGFLYITGRKKEILITSGGENIAPVPIEENIKRQLDIVSNAMVVADRRKFISALLTLKTESDAEGVPTDKLLPSVKDWLKSRGCNASTVPEVLQNMPESVTNAIQEGIDKANLNAISNAAQVRKWIILPKDFSMATGEFGPTTKLCRHVVLDKYSSLISSMYAV